MITRCEISTWITHCCKTQGFQAIEYISTKTRLIRMSGIRIINPFIDCSSYMFKKTPKYPRVNSCNLEFAIKENLRRLHCAILRFVPLKQQGIERADYASKRVS